MLLEEDIRHLLSQRTETKNLDYKEKFNWKNSSKDEKVELVKDILAMANTQDGGKIIFGVRNKDYEHVDMTEEDYISFDQTSIHDFLHNYTEPKHTCHVCKHKIDDRYLVVIDVPEFEEVPIICKTDYHSSDDPSKQILKKGQIYIRTDKATSEVISSTEQMRELLGRALTKKGDELLNIINRLIKGKPLRASEESEEKYNNEIKEAELYLSNKIGDELEKYGHWAIYTYPTEYNPSRIAEKNIRELIQKGKANLTGYWPFPHTNTQNASNFPNGRQSYTIEEIDREGYLAFKSGLFVWKKVFYEDIHNQVTDDGERVLFFNNIINLVTEAFLFFKRYYEQSVPETDLNIKIVLNGTNDRRLTRSDYPRRLRGFYVAHVDSIPVEIPLKVVELSASYKEIANDVIRRIFFQFNWDDASEEFVDELQTKLIKGRV